MKKLIFVIGIAAGLLCSIAFTASAFSTFQYIQGGTGSTTAPVSQLLYGGASSYQSVSTTSATCTGTASCSAFTVIGTSPVSISAVGSTFGTTSISALFPLSWNTSTAQLSWLGLATTSSWTANQLAYVVNGNTVGSVATGTVSGASVISLTSGQSIIGSGLTITTTGGTFGAGDYIFPSNLDLSADTAIFKLNSTNAFFIGVAASANINIGQVNVSTASAKQGTDNTAVGYAIGGDTLGARNVFIGSRANVSATNGQAVNDSVGIGYKALTRVRTAGNGNIGIGANTSNTVTTGSYNIAIGSGADFPLATTFRSLNIGNVLFGTGLYNDATVPNDAAMIGGTIGISTTSPGAEFAIQAVHTATTPLLFLIGSSTANSTSTLFSVSNTGLASTTNLVVSSAGGAAGCATFSANGTISNTGSACGSISLPVSVANGGTGTTTQILNGINFFDGDNISSKSDFEFSTSTQVLGIDRNFSHGTASFQASGGRAVFGYNGSNAFLDAGAANKGIVLTVNGDSLPTVTVAPAASVAVVVQAQTGVYTDVQALSPTGAVAPEANFTALIHPNVGGNRWVDWDNNNAANADFVSATEGVSGGADLVPFGVQFCDTVVSKCELHYIAMPGGTNAFGIAGTSSVDLTASFQIASNTAATLFEVDTFASNHIFTVGRGGATTTGTLAVTGSTTIGSQLSATHGATFGNFTGLLATTTQATTTSFAISSIATGNLLKTTTGGAVVAALADTDYATPSLLAGNTFRDWNVVSGYLTPTTTLGILVSASSTIGAGGQTTGLTINGGATTTQNGYFASKVLIGTATTSSDLNIATTISAYNANSTLNTRSNNVATTFNFECPEVTNQTCVYRLFRSTNTSGTVALDIMQGTNANNINSRLLGGSTGTTYFNALGGSVGIASTTAYGRLSIHANNGATNKILFAIGSSTQSATSTLFYVDNTGTASTTNLVISSAGTGVTRCLQVAADGTVSAAASACGSASGLSSYDAWTHPNAGDSATTSQIIINAASSTIVGNLNITGNATATNATTTSFNTTVLRVNSESFLDLTGTGLSLSAGALTNTGVISVSGTAPISCSGTNPATCTTTPGTFVTGNYVFPTSLTLSATTSSMLTAFDPNGTLVATSSPTLAVFFATSTTATSTIAGYLSISATGRLIVPVTANPTVSIAGQVAIDNTAASTSLRWADAVNSEHAFFVAPSRSLVLASSTLAYIGAYGASGSTTIRLANFLRPTKITTFYCKTDAGTAYVGFGTGSATTTLEANCSTSGVAITPASNNTWTMRQDFFVEVGRTTGTPNVITITAEVEQQAD